MHAVELRIVMCSFRSLCCSRYSQDNNSYYYPREKHFGHGPTPELPGWDNGDGEHAIPVHLFQKHVAELHLDQVS